MKVKVQKHGEESHSPPFAPRQSSISQCIIQKILWKNSKNPLEKQVLQESYNSRVAPLKTKETLFSNNHKALFPSAGSGERPILLGKNREEVDMDLTYGHSDGLCRFLPHLT